MRDAANLRGTFPESIRKALSQNNSRMHSILIIIIILSLTAIAGYLAYDILSNRSIGAFDSFFSSHQGKGSVAAIDGWQEKGTKLFKAGKYNESIECFDKAISEKSTNPIAWKYKGMALYALGDYKSAIKCYDEALLLNSSDGESLYNKGLALLAMNKTDEARDTFAKAEKLGKWPNPMHSKFSPNTTSVKSGSNAVKGESRIIVNWDLVNSEEHSSAGGSPDYNLAAPKTSTTKDISHTNSNKAPKNNSSITSTGASSANMTAANATEINGNSTENSSTGPSIKATEGGSAISRAKKAVKAPSVSLTRSLEPKTQINEVKKSIKPPKKPIALKAKDQGSQVDKSASGSTNGEKTSDAKATSKSSSPDTQVSSKKKSIKTPPKPAAPKAPAAKLKTTKKQTKK